MSDHAAGRARGYFVTGTDTGVGKTLIACGLLRAHARSGLRVVGMKPVAAGARLQGGVLLNDDVVALRAAANVAASAELVNPYCFEPAIAPHIAAAEAGVAIDIARVTQAARALAAQADVVIVEGAGGFRVPLDAGSDMADLAAALGMPVVLVVGMRLGCLNHALLTADAVRSRGLTLCAWVANHVERDMARSDENVAALAERIGAPLLARIPFEAAPSALRSASAMRIDLLR